jgi:hypothetical protein
VSDSRGRQPSPVLTSVDLLMRNLETWTAAVALALATLLVSPAIGLIALVISAVSFGLTLARAGDHGQDH